MCDEPMHGANLGGVPSLCDLAHHKESPMTLHGRSVVYTLLEDSLREEKLEERKVFITRQLNMITNYMVMRKIVDICLWQHGQGRDWERSGGNRRGCAYQKNGQKQRWD